MSINTHSFLTRFLPFIGFVLGFTLSFIYGNEFLSFLPNNARFPAMVAFVVLAPSLFMRYLVPARCPKCGGVARLRGWQHTLNAYKCTHCGEASLAEGGAMRTEGWGPEYQAVFNRFAQENNMSAIEGDDPELFKRLTIYRYGYPVFVRQLFSRKTSDYEIFLIELQSRGDSTGPGQIVIGIISPQLELPRFSVYWKPELPGVFGKVPRTALKLGQHQELDLMNISFSDVDADFDKGFLIVAKNAAAVKRFLDRAKRDVIREVGGDVMIDADADTLFFTRMMTNSSSIVADNKGAVVRAMIRDTELIFNKFRKTY